MSASFGFIGSDYILPLWLAVLSLLFLLTNALRTHHDRMNAFARPAAAPSASLPPVTGQSLQ
jgi:hypothetical protein